MPYRFSRERLDHSDFASGRVFRSQPGRTAFPVRLADELFQRCLAIRAANGAYGTDGTVVLYDPCCGGASLLCTLAFLHWPSIRQIVASDADPDAVVLASRNLELLTRDGIAERRQEIADHLAAFGKASHADALQSAERLASRIVELGQTHPLPTRIFLADALDAADLRANLEPRSIDVVVADVPYGQRTHWLHSAAGPGVSNPADAADASAGTAPGPADASDGSIAVRLLLEALWPALAPNAVVAIVGDKSQRARHERYAPAGTLQIGKRRATFLRLVP